jgi:hypothetical protein
MVANTQGGETRETMKLDPTKSPLNTTQGQRCYASGPVVGRQEDLALLYEALLRIETQRRSDDCLEWIVQSGTRGVPKWP